MVRTDEKSCLSEKKHDEGCWRLAGVAIQEGEVPR